MTAFEKGHRVPDNEWEIATAGAIHVIQVTKADGSEDVVREEKGRPRRHLLTLPPGTGWVYSATTEGTVGAIWLHGDSEQSPWDVRVTDLETGATRQITQAVDRDRYPTAVIPLVNIRAHQGRYLWAQPDTSKEPLDPHRIIIHIYDVRTATLTRLTESPVNAEPVWFGNDILSMVYIGQDKYRIILLDGQTYSERAVPPGLARLAKEPGMRPFTGEGFTLIPTKTQLYYVSHAHPDQPILIATSPDDFFDGLSSADGFVGFRNAVGSEIVWDLQSGSMAPFPGALEFTGDRAHAQLERDHHILNMYVPTATLPRLPRCPR